MTKTARNAGQIENVNLLPMKWGGHCYLARKCMSGQSDSSDMWERHVNGIVLPEVVADRSCALIVLRVGPRVGQPVGEEHAKLLDRDTCVLQDIGVGDCIVCPNMHVGIQVSPLSSDEYFIEESVPTHVLEKEA